MKSSSSEEFILKLLSFRRRLIWSYAGHSLLYSAPDARIEHRAGRNFLFLKISDAKEICCATMSWVRFRPGRASLNSLRGSALSLVDREPEVEAGRRTADPGLA